MKTVERLTPAFVVVLLTMGFTLHLANLGQYAHHHQTRLASIISPVMDGMLGLWMALCAALLLLRWRPFFDAYQMHGWRQVVYWILTVYVTASVPGHVRYVLTRDTSYFDFFPWWFSPIIMVVYVLFIAFLLSLLAQGRRTNAPVPT
jgi:hypothetical protein